MHKQPEPNWARGLQAPKTDQEPAVPILESVTPERITCLEDGRELQMLTRYLRSRHNMTPDEYRTKWGLPPNYPMIAEVAAAKKAEIAKSGVLGKHSRTKET